MAYKAILGEDLRTTMFENEFVEHFWSISRTVGWGCTNYYDDVMLVQYLVNVWAKDKALKMDGIFGNKTYKDANQWLKDRQTIELVKFSCDEKPTNSNLPVCLSNLRYKFRNLFSTLEQQPNAANYRPRIINNLVFCTLKRLF